ncbi:hypothetical protein [Aliidiomarina sanyensis]|uniref:Adhesin domain-containing protein n=1 Tax=Aliidiomarina sanyensis TaxID=1249555 RepID=A0A432WPN5_9GAMM|nr:hypothetical protein [Aliidiomarina sanyensis]RUO35770.1 hypothetical protein CWE11_03155 [Aliidiomarina sanyensis]
MKIQYIVAGGCVVLIALHLVSNAQPQANSRCAVSKTETFQLNDSDAKKLIVNIGPDRANLRAGRERQGSITVRFCASDDNRMRPMAADLVIEDEIAQLQLNHGGQSNRSSTSWFGRTRSSYSYFEIDGQVNAFTDLDISVGSGKADLFGFSNVNAVLGSGEIDIAGVPNEVRIQVGSGKAELDNIGSLRVGSVGSGKIEVERIRGDAEIGSIGSGKIELERVDGGVTVGTIGSGSFQASRVRGNLSIGSVGSGSIRIDDVEGDFHLRSKGSGSVRHTNVRGKVTVPNR